MISSSGGGSVFAEPPHFFVQSLQASCPGTFLKRVLYSYDETVWPVVGLAFRRVVDPNSLLVLHEKISGKGEKFAPELAAENCAPVARWCIYQRTMFGREEHLMDLVHQDGSLHPFDGRVIAAIKRREVKDKTAALEWVNSAAERPAIEAEKRNAEVQYGLADVLRWYRRFSGGVFGDYYLGGADGTQKAPQACKGYKVIDRRASAKMGAVA